jgi:hypothetical protein
MLGCARCRRSLPGEEEGRPDFRDEKGQSCSKWRIESSMSLSRRDAPTTASFEALGFDSLGTKAIRPRDPPLLQRRRVICRAARAGNTRPSHFLRLAANG